MKREYLFNKTKTVINNTKVALETVYNALNNGQRKKLLKNEEVKALFERYGVEYEVSE